MNKGLEQGLAFAVAASLDRGQHLSACVVDLLCGRRAHVVAVDGFGEFGASVA
ncbi:MAG: hypothetical protein M3454_05180 [Actinomycetota bacterium]|nr:hypothetical protein [Actinomycetota bacterium]